MEHLYLQLLSKHQQVAGHTHAACRGTTTQQKPLSEQFSHCSFNAFLPLLQMTTFKINFISSLSKVSMNTGNCAQKHLIQKVTVYEITQLFLGKRLMSLDGFVKRTRYLSEHQSHRVHPVNAPIAGPLFSPSLCVARHTNKTELEKFLLIKTSSSPKQKQFNKLKFSL